MSDFEALGIVAMFVLLLGYGLALGYAVDLSDEIAYELEEVEE